MRTFLERNKKTLFGSLRYSIYNSFIGKIYNETKRRPRYIIAETLMEDKNEKNN